MPNPIAAIYTDPTSTLEIRYDDGTKDTISPVSQQHVIQLHNQKGQAAAATMIATKTKPGRTVVTGNWK